MPDVQSEFSDLALELDPSTGTLARLRRGSHVLRCAVAATVVVGGSERRGPVGGLVYDGTTEVGLGGPSGPVRERVEHDSRTFTVPVGTTAPQDWSAEWHYTLRHDTPALAVSLELRALRDGLVARDVVVEVRLGVDEPERWRVHAPGNKLRPGLTVAELAYECTVYTAGGVDGSTGLVVLESGPDPQRGPASCLVWPLSRTEIGDVALSPAAGGVGLRWSTQVAGAPGAGGVLRVRELLLDLVPGSFHDLLPSMPDVIGSLGLRTPGDPPDWGLDANLYEVQVGFAAMAHGERYAPYPQAQDLLDDIDRIASLGYTALQLMPQQPYPSYNVHDYDDVSVSWCDEGVLRQIVERCHERGMRVILDILLHGVIDGEALDATLAAIEQGPFVGRVGEVSGDITVLERHELDEIDVTWTRHVLDFEPYWRAGSPRRHALLDAHPEWFCRDSSGAVTGMYTQAFDTAHPGWQRYFIDSALALVERLGIDGFRLDAPSYNAFHNWSPRTRANAGVSMLGSLSLFETLRREMRERFPDALLYTEPSGLLFRQHMDLNYNYDEQWLTKAVVNRGAGHAHWVRNARELVAWFEQRDACLPRGSLTAHHLDSHDTYWWPEPGSKWRREQIGLPASAALMTVYALSGGPYMTFVGGEVGMEDQVRTVNHLRLSHPVFARGVTDYRAVTAGHDDVYAVLRRLDDRAGLVLANLSDEPVVSTVLLERERWPDGGDPLPDLLGGAPLLPERPDGAAVTAAGLGAEVALGPWECRAYEVTAGG